MNQRVVLGLLTFVSVLTIVSCNKHDDDGDWFPDLNKTSFSLSTTKPDTLYSCDGRDFTIPLFQIKLRKDNTSVYDFSAFSLENVIKINGKEIGTITYYNGKVNIIDIPGLCKISLLKNHNGKFRHAYIIQAYENAASSPYYMTMSIMDTGPREVTIK